MAEEVPPKKPKEAARPGRAGAEGLAVQPPMIPRVKRAPASSLSSSSNRPGWAGGCGSSSQVPAEAVVEEGQRSGPSGSTNPAPERGAAAEEPEKVSAGAQPAPDSEVE